MSVCENLTPRDSGDQKISLESIVINNIFITDSDGKRVAVIIPIKENETLLEELHFIKAARDSKDDTSRPLGDVVEEMRGVGEIDI